MDDARLLPQSEGRYLEAFGDEAIEHVDDLCPVP